VCVCVYLVAFDGEGRNIVFKRASDHQIHLSKKKIPDKSVL
jgi:hypothetical protein